MFFRNFTNKRASYSVGHAYYSNNDCNIGLFNQCVEFSVVSQLEKYLHKLTYGVINYHFEGNHLFYHYGFASIIV